MTPHFSIEKLGSSHHLDDFDCGSLALNRFLVRFALTSRQTSSSQTYVGMADRAIAGLYTLAVGQVCSRKLEMSQFRKLAITQAAGLNYVILK